MELEIENYIGYLTNGKKSSQNTVQSYRRDLVKMQKFFESNGVTNVKDVNTTIVRSYVLYIIACNVLKPAFHHAA